jgi:hypothetical protein
MATPVPSEKEACISKRDGGTLMKINFYDRCVLFYPMIKIRRALKDPMLPVNFWWIRKLLYWVVIGKANTKGTSFEREENL